MYKTFVLLFLSSLLLIARENPFFPAKNTKQINITSNQIKAYTPLEKIPFSLPSSARVLQEVTLKFINIDGSVGSKTLQVQNSIDWHKPIMISQPQAISIVQHPHKSSSKKSDQQFVKVIRFHDFLTLKVLKKSVQLVTKDKNIRHFMMVHPYRVVIDFKKTSDFLSYVKKIKNSVCTSVAIGNHDGYYRVVLFLDGQYHFSFKATQYGYNIHFY